MFRARPPLLQRPYLTVRWIKHRKLKNGKLGRRPATPRAMMTTTKEMSSDRDPKLMTAIMHPANRRRRKPRHPLKSPPNLPRNKPRLRLKDLTSRLEHTPQRGERAGCRQTLRCVQAFDAKKRGLFKHCACLISIQISTGNAVSQYRVKSPQDFQGLTYREHIGQDGFTSHLYKERDIERKAWGKHGGPECWEY